MSSKQWIQKFEIGMRNTKKYVHICENTNVFSMYSSLMNIITISNNTELMSLFHDIDGNI